MTNLTKTATALHERLNNNNNETTIKMNYDGTILHISRHDKDVHVTNNDNIDFTADIKNVAHFLNNFSTIINNPSTYYGYFKQHTPTEEEYYAQMAAEETTRQKELEEDYLSESSSKKLLLLKVAR